jgi:penicillin-binding protein 1A
MQVIARKAMQRGLIRYDTLRGYRGPKTQIDVSSDWGVPLGEVKTLDDVPEWQVAVVLESSDEGLSIGLQPKREGSGALSADRDRGFVSLEDMKWALRHVVNGERVKANSPSDVLKAGDVVYVEKKEGSDGYLLRQPPGVSGGMVVMDPHTGRVLAMVGGFSYAESEFNRATQAMRQPGSSFKPFVYAAALDNGYTPASVIMDGPITITVGNETWSPKNYDGKAAGPSTLRNGIERSRNLMTVRLANDMGMKTVAEYAERFGVYDKMGQYLPMALGSGETTVMRMVSAYSVMANGGKQIKPSLIDRIQDRYGKTVFRHDERGCEGCSATDWENQQEPELVDNAEQVLDPMTAYQITSMMEGVVQRGTATILKDLNRPIAGKTGTTNDEKDAWFVGYTPNLVAGLYIGFDQPQPLGKGTTGGGLAAPIFKEFIADALKGVRPIEFQVPEGMKLIAIDRKTGMQAGKGDPNTIIEAFKPGTGPADSYWVIGMDDGIQASGAALSPRAKQVIDGGGGGLY